MASVAVLCYCRGCGNDLSNKAKYRRVMKSVSSRSVLPGWRMIAELKLKEKNLTADLDGELGTATNPGYMCRSCFTNYEKVQKVARFTP